MILSWSIHADHEKYHARSHPLISAAISHVRNHSELHHSPCLQPTSSTSELTSSNRTPIWGNQNRFGSLQQQNRIGCCVSRSSNHDSGTTMLDANLGGNLACLNTTFTSCIRESNAPASYPNKNYTTSSQRFTFDASSPITSPTFTLCTFREMITAVGSFNGGGAIFMSSGASLTVRQCSFHVNHVTAENDDGGTINIICPENTQNKLEIDQLTFTECKSTELRTNYGGCVINGK
ncbi:hypothetical protein BLNAU_21204 [Blattamonas nauphoetae]|uniref:Uncharacterized protein n=1 Tax=Blattamonas nauphoetae TaxID=2049346 RepID=A0ABQ9WYR2_9EUKA|nr:hypothetical protein BLNAU_21204 [Blattamonas nauphoetae]